jgi:Domain of unknown function (DUF1851)
VSNGQRLFIPASDIDAARVMATWSSILRAPYRLLCVSAFGDLFLARSDDSVDMLDLVGGVLKQVAVCIEEFEYSLQSDEGQTEWLMAPLAGRAAEAGMRPARGQCLAFRTPPLLGGTLNSANLVVWDLYAYHAGLAKLLPQILGLPPGTAVVPRPDSDNQG